MNLYIYLYISPEAPGHLSETSHASLPGLRGTVVVGGLSIPELEPVVDGGVCFLDRDRKPSNLVPIRW